MENDHSFPSTPVIVTTKAQLEAAQKAKAPEILVKGEIATSLRRTKTITKLGAATLGVLATALAAAPFTGGTSLAVGSVAFASVAATTGVEVAAIVGALSIGLGLILAIYSEYDEIEVGLHSIKLRRRSKS